MSRTLTTALLGLAIALAVASSSEAASIRIYDGVNPAIIITDNGAGDIDSTLGEIGNVTFGYGVWAVTLTAGRTQPALGSTADPEMEFTVSATSTTAGTLYVDFSETGFTQTGGALASIQGSTAGSLTYSTWQDLGNALFIQSQSITTQAFTPGLIPLSSDTGALVPGSPYSLTQRVTISHTAGGISTAVTTFSVPDGGSASVMLGFGVLAMGWARRRFLK
jgi:hypothetical protein